jgi:hypothetical protein
MKKGTRVIRILTGAGHRTCSGPYEVVAVKKGQVFISDSSLKYDVKTGLEIDPSIPGWRSEIIAFEE